jgi:acetyltransferase-like isoleucine patch superfamily enzyme
MDFGGAISRATSAWRLFSVTRVGKRAQVRGTPYVSNRGSIVIGDDFRFGSSPSQSHLITTPGALIDIGDRVVISFGAAISAQREVRIGDDTEIGPFAVIMDADFHRADDRSQQGEMGPIRVGKGVQIGARVTILRGSEIGDGARIASGSMVSGKVPAGAVYGGVPARPVSEKAETDALDIPALIMRVLGLHERPAPSDGPDQIPQWDSLGALRLLLAIEDTFDIALGEDDMKSARSVAQLTDVVSAARDRAAQKHTNGA